MLTNSKLTMQMTMTPEKTNYLNHGPDGQKLLKQGPSLQNYRGINIINSRSFATEEGARPRDLLNRRVRVAEYYVVSGVKKSDTGYIELYDQSRDQMFRISLEELFVHSHLPGDAAIPVADAGGARPRHVHFGAINAAGLTVKTVTALGNQALKDAVKNALYTQAGRMPPGANKLNFHNAADEDTFDGYVNQLELRYRDACPFMEKGMHRLLVGGGYAKYGSDMLKENATALKTSTHPLALLHDMASLPVFPDTSRFTKATDAANGWLAKVHELLVEQHPALFPFDKEAMLKLHNTINMAVAAAVAPNNDSAGARWKNRIIQVYMLYVYFAVIANANSNDILDASGAGPDIAKRLAAIMFSQYDNGKWTTDSPAPAAGGGVAPWETQSCGENIPNELPTKTFVTALSDDVVQRAIRVKLCSGNESNPYSAVEYAMSAARDMLLLCANVPFSELPSLPSAPRGDIIGDDPDRIGRNPGDVGVDHLGHPAATDKFDYVIVRPNIEHNMLGVVLGRGGKDDLGCTFWGQTELSVYDDAMHGKFGMSYK